MAESYLLLDRVARRIRACGTFGIVWRRSSEFLEGYEGNCALGKPVPGRSGRWCRDVAAMVSREACAYWKDDATRQPADAHGVAI